MFDKFEYVYLSRVGYTHTFFLQKLLSTSYLFLLENSIKQLLYYYNDIDNKNNEW